MNQEYEGLGPDERMVLSQLFREMGKEERGEPEREMQERDEQVSPGPADSQGMKASFSVSVIGPVGARREKAPRICATLL